jgi:multimeric flavodoxin WrbA
MTSSSDTFGRVKVAAITSASDETPVFKLFLSLVQLLNRAHCEVSEVKLAKMKLNACDGCYASGGRTCLLPCDYNDIDEEIYDPSDKGVLITDSLVDCELLLVVAEARCGGVDSLTQRFLERLKPFDNLARLQHQRLLDNKFAVVVAVGDGADAAVGQMSARLLGLGLSIPAYGSISVEIESFWTRDHGLKVVQGDGDVQHRLQDCVSSAIKQASSVKRR